MSDCKTLARPGYWCEWLLHTPKKEFGARLLLASERPGAVEAMIWVCVLMKVRMPKISNNEARKIEQFVEHGYAEPLRRLMNEEPFSFTISEGNTTLEWAIRRAIFLPLYDLHHHPPTHKQ
jgi:hypothetical protein